jgi:acetoin utilization deacetylase AcuC-like enzyme
VTLPRSTPILCMLLSSDYHCGNGTASIFYEDPTVLMVSLHCDPDFDYPFHSGFSDQTGLGAGEGTTLYLPMPPKAQWDSLYKGCLETGLKRIQEFGTKAVVISMGLDTHDKDPCAIRRAGFCLQGTDYMELGKTMARSLKGLPVVIIQEGGYRMETIGQAASNVVFGYHGEM